MKRIESILPEHAADELTRMLAGDDATATAALTRLLHDWTGCDIPQSSDLPESEVEELVPLCVSILRRHWQTPLTCIGDGNTPMSLADLLRQTIGDRVQGNEAWSIPAVHGDIPTVVATLTQRHIDDGLTLTLADASASLPDGISLAQVLMGTITSSITMIEDGNHGWTMQNNAIFNTFTNADEFTLNCKDHIPNPSYGYNHSQGFLKSNNNVKRLNIPEFEGWKASGTAFSCYIAANCTNIEEIHAPSMGCFNGENSATNTNNISKCPKLWWVEMGDMRDKLGGSEYYFYQCPNLIRLEFKGVQGSMKLSQWSPTTALAERLPEFLSNFQTYIADRVLDVTGQNALTLTLSAAVYEALQAQEGQTILATLTNKNWTVAQA